LPGISRAFSGYISANSSDKKVSAHSLKQAGRGMEVTLVVAPVQNSPGFSPPQPMPLFVTPSHLLNKFIKDFLQPNKLFLKQIKEAVDIICSFLKNVCFLNSDTKVLKTVKVSAGPSLIPVLGSQENKVEGKQCLTFPFLPREDPLPKAQL
jgi:hypothetical protein